MDIISEAIRVMEQTSFVLVKCQLHMLDVGHGLRSEHIVYVMLDIECAIQHEKSIPAMTVHSTANNHTPDVTLVLFSDAGISKMLAPMMPPIDPSIAMGKTKHGLIFKMNSVPIAGMSTKVVHHLGEHWSTLLPIQDGAPIQASGMQCKSPQVITHGLCGYLGVMMSWCFCHPIKFWSEYANPVMVWLLEVTHYVDGLVVPISCRQCLNHGIIVCVTLKCLAPSATLKLVCSIPIVLVDDGGRCRLFFVELETSRTCLWLN